MFAGGIVFSVFAGVLQWAWAVFHVLVITLQAFVFAVLTVHNRHGIAGNECPDGFKPNFRDTHPNQAVFPDADVQAGVADILRFAFER